MEYFSEIYGEAYLAVAAVLSTALAAPLTRQEITAQVEALTSGEEAIYITDRLLGGQWPLLVADEKGMYRSAVKNVPTLPLTDLQRSWLAAILADRRCGAFLSPEQRADIASALDCAALYDCGFVEDAGGCSDGDDFSDPQYAARLQTILEAIGQRRILLISYTGGSGKAISGDFLPCRLEYSSRDDKLRLHAVRIRYGKVIFLATINLGRIERVSDSRESFGGCIGIDALRREQRSAEPAVVEITDLRNALERFMVQFAGYEKRTRYVAEEDRYICSLYYEKGYETELIIRLLSFGPVVRLLSPEPLVEQLRERVKRQWELMN